MWQRIVRSRWFYGLLILSTVLIYLLLRPHTERPSREPSLSTEPQSLELWPKELDVTTLQATLMQQPLLAATFVVVMLMAAFFMIGGVVLTVRGVWKGALKQFWKFPERQLPSWSFGEVTRIIVLALFMICFLPIAQLFLTHHDVLPPLDFHAGLTVSMFFLDVFVGMLIIVFARTKGPSLRDVFGLEDAHTQSAIRIGLRSYWTAFPWLFGLLMIVAYVMRMFHIQQPVEPIQELVFGEQRPAVLGLIVLLACTVGPAVEELFFRGVLYPAIRQRTSRLIGMLISGAIFALLHTNIAGFIPIMALGCLLAYLYERTGSIAAPLAVHIVHNSFLISTAFVFRQLMASAGG